MSVLNKYIWLIIYYVNQQLHIYITILNLTSKLPEDGAEAPKHVGAFVIYMCVCAFVDTNNKKRTIKMQCMYIKIKAHMVLLCT